jgi:hypothetical protein
MKNRFDIYPRGVVINEAQSNTLIRPTGAKGNYVFWLAASGYVYKTRREAIDDLAPAAMAAMPHAVELQKGERLLYHRGDIGAQVMIPETWDAEVADRFKRISATETPYKVSASTKPGQRSTLWISSTSRAYATYNHAVTDNPAYALDREPAAVSFVGWGLAALAVVAVIATVTLLKK